MRLFNYYHRKRAARLGLRLADLGAIGRSSILEAEPPASLGHVRISTTGLCLRLGAHSYVRSGELLLIEAIGRFCSIGSDVVLGLDARAHPLTWASSSVELCHDYHSPSTAARIGHDVWLGHSVRVNAGVTIGNGAVVGSGSVVTRDVSPYTIVAGVPAQPLRQRFAPEVCAALEASRWWDKPLPALRRLDFRDPARFAKQAALLPDTVYPRLRIARRRLVSVG